MPLPEFAKPFLRRSLRATVRAVARRDGPRRLFNRVYGRLGTGGREFLQRHFAHAFAAGDPRVQPGAWVVDFAGRPVRLPLDRASMHVGWNAALSVLGHDVEVKRTYEALLRASHARPDLFLDVGGNFGTHSILFLAHGVETLTFEPNPACHPYFRALCEANGVRPGLRDVALGDAPGEAELVFPEGETWLGTIAAAGRELLAARPAHGAMTARTVPVARLDDVVPDGAGRRILIKIDAEGSEPAILRGAARLLREARPSIVFEAARESDRAGLLDQLAAAGFRVHTLPFDPAAPSPPLDREAFLAHPGQNYLARPAD